MVPSSALCRAQEAYQRGRATGAVLANVRMIAEKAAIAWNIEALVPARAPNRSCLRRSAVLSCCNHPAE